MIYGAADSKSRTYYTFLRDIFNAIDNEQLKYNWLITDSEIAAHSERLNKLNTRQFPDPDYRFLTGEELTEIVTQDDSQWIWGVLTGFDKDVSLDEILRYSLPETDNYNDFQNIPLSFQHPLASMEIAALDSSLVLLLSREKEAIDKFRLAFPQCLELNENKA